jgi:hypothetical protein
MYVDRIYAYVRFRTPFILSLHFWIKEEGCSKIDTEIILNQRITVCGKNRLETLIGI